MGIFHPIAAKKVQRHLIEAHACLSRSEKIKAIDVSESGGTLDAFRHTFTMAYLSHFVKLRN